MRFIAFAAVVLSINAAFAACGGSSSKATPTSTAAQVATATAAPSGKATPAPSTRVFSMQLLAIAYGWALTDAGLRWTEDGGQTWRDITPPGGANLVFFLNSSEGWAARAQRPKEGTAGPSTVSVFRTIDRGRTWQPSSFQGPYLPPNPPPAFGLSDVQFVDEQNGWVIGDLSSKFASSLVHRTTDGGKTWTTLISSSNGETKGLFWGFTGVGHHYIRFLNAQDGWVAATGGPLLVTHDGGEGWRREPLPYGFGEALPDDCKQKDVDYGALEFFDSHHGVLTARWSCDHGQTGVTIVYVTKDSGRSWEIAEKRTDGTVSAVLRPTVWIEAQGDRLLKTVDRGATWTDVTEDWSPILSAGSRLSFLDSLHGWALVQGQLRATADGGHTWKVLQP